MAVKCAMQVGLFRECESLPNHPLMGLCLAAIFGVITPLTSLGTSIFLSLCWLWFIHLCEACECVKTMRGKARDGWKVGNVQAFCGYRRERGRYTEPRAYLCLHLFLSLLILGLLLCVTPPVHYLSFSLARFLFRHLSPAPTLFLSAQMPQSDWQHIKWNKASAAVSDRS